MSPLPARMRAWEIASAGGIDALALNERPLPRPGPGEVLVRVHANSLNYRDLSTVQDPVARGIPYPRIPNSDGAGEVVATGAGVDEVRRGERVAGCFFQRWDDGAIDAAAMASALGGPRDGVLSEYALLEARGLVPLPAHLSWAEGATLPCAGVTAWNCLFEVGGVRAGDMVLLLGTGGVSIVALQLAVLHGARVIITSSDDAKLERARELGAWATVNYRATPQWHEAVVAASGGEGVDFALEVGGGGTLARTLQAVRVGGCIALIGVLSKGELDPTPIMRKSVRVQGVYVGSRRMFRALNKAVAAHRLAPVIDRRFAFADARAAFHHMAEARHFGKLVIEL